MFQAFPASIGLISSLFHCVCWEKSQSHTELDLLLIFFMFPVFISWVLGWPFRGTEAGREIWSLISFLNREVCIQMVASIPSPPMFAKIIKIHFFPLAWLVFLCWWSLFFLFLMSFFINLIKTSFLHLLNDSITFPDLSLSLLFTCLPLCFTVCTVKFFNTSSQTHSETAFWCFHCKQWNRLT